MDKKDVYIEKLHAQLMEWSSDIDKLKAKADNAKADAKVEYQKKIEELNAMHNSASMKLNELKASSSDAWEELKGGVDAFWSTLSNAIKAAASHFK